MAKIEKYVELDRQANTLDEKALRVRRKFGKLMLVERNGKAKLPKGRIAELCKATGKKEREIRYRMQFAEAYDTEEKFGNAVAEFGSWHAITEALSGKRKAKLARKKLPPLMRRLTPNGHRVEECRSVLQKAIRRGDEDLAMYVAVEICLHDGGEDGSGYSLVWNALQTIGSEDISLTEPVAQEISALHQNFLDAKKRGQLDGACRLHLTRAVLRLCRAAKNRETDHTTIRWFEGHREKIDFNSLADKPSPLFEDRPKREVPDYALDMHTRRGHQMGRGVEHFFAEGAKLANEDGLPDPHRKQARQIRLTKAAATGR